MITFRKLGKLGRFGNELFQYAGTRLYAELNDFHHAFPAWSGSRAFRNMRAYTDQERMRSLFLPTIQVADMQAVGRLDRLRGLAGLWRRGNVQELYTHPQDNVDLYGYCQDPYSLDLLAAHRQRIRSWFSWLPELDDAFRQATARYLPWVAVHVRRGDFVQRRTTVPISLYAQELEKHPSETPIFVASDDPTVREQLRHFNLVAPKNPLPSSSLYVPDDLFTFWMLAHASTVYGCGSTFSWWAAYLGDVEAYVSPPLSHLWPNGYQPTFSKQTL